MINRSSAREELLQKKIASGMNQSLECSPDAFETESPVQLTLGKSLTAKNSPFSRKSTVVRFNGINHEGFDSNN